MCPFLQQEGARLMQLYDDPFLPCEDSDSETVALLAVFFCASFNAMAP